MTRTEATNGALVMSAEEMMPASFVIPGGDGLSSVDPATPSLRRARS